MMKKVYLVLLLAGIVLRIFSHFIVPNFNVDEISLGNSIKYSNYIDLLYPLTSLQSAPPLYLLIQKFIISVLPFSFWMNIKILSFISSILGVLFFYFIIKKYQFKSIFLLLFIIILFNPFIVYNSLTVKQYTIDLTGIILLIYLFKSNWFLRYGWIYFIVWCLISNVGLFACAGYLIYTFFIHKSYVNYKSIIIYFKNNILIFLSPFPYLIYFFWYMNQNGAAEQKSFMVNYWANSFIPLNGGFFKYIIYTVHGLWVYLLNAFEIWGILLMLLMIPFFVYIKRKELLFKQEIFLLFSILMVHLILNIFHLYPFSDRLYLYLAPLFVLILGSSISELFEIKKIKKYFSVFIITISMITLFLYSLYTPYSDNDVANLYNKLNELGIKTVYVTEKSMDCIQSFNEFTDNEFNRGNTFKIIDEKLEKSQYIISRVSKKIKFNVTSPEEDIVQNLINKKRIVKINSVNGYNIFQIR